jgi:hypothetical protein
MGKKFVPFVAAFAVFRRVIFGAGRREKSFKNEKFSAVSVPSALRLLVAAMPRRAFRTQESMNPMR